MGWKGTVRSIQASARAADRDAQRRKRELEKQRKAHQKLAEQEQAAYEVSVYQNHVELIQSMHKQCGTPIDWGKIRDAGEPKKPERNSQHEAAFKSGFFTKLFGNEDKKRSAAIAKDDAVFQNELVNWQQNHQRWQDHGALARKLIQGDGDPGSKVEVIQTVNPFKDINELGTQVDISIAENCMVEATLHAYGENIVPVEAKSLLQSGKLSVKKLPKAKFNDIYQDYVCSAALRIGNEILAMVPDDLVIVHIKDKLLNTATGHIEDQYILSVAISRATIASLNMDRIDPSDSLENFIHNIDFKGAQGFKGVEPLSAKDYSPKIN